MVVWWWAVRCPMGRKRLQFSEEFVRKPRVAACFFFQSGCQVACGLCLGVVGAVLGDSVGSAWWVGWIVLDGCLGYDWRMFGLCFVDVWAMLGGCVGYSWRLYILRRKIACTAFCGCLGCILWLPGLLSVVARAAFCGSPGCIIPAVAVCFWNMRESPCRIVCCDRGSPLLCCRPRPLRSCRQSSVVAEFCQFTKCPLAL